MAEEIKKQKLSTAKDLKQFLLDIPDNIPIRGSFDEPMIAYLWKADKRESGPRKFIGFEEE